MLDVIFTKLSAAEHLILHSVLTQKITAGQQIEFGYGPYVYSEAESILASGLEQHRYFKSELACLLFDTLAALRPYPDILCCPAVFFS